MPKYSLQLWREVTVPLQRNEGRFYQLLLAGSDHIQPCHMDGVLG